MRLIKITGITAFIISPKAVNIPYFQPSVEVTLDAPALEVPYSLISIPL